jgi:hypothetical protein
MPPKQYFLREHNFSFKLIMKLCKSKNYVRQYFLFFEGLQCFSVFFHFTGRRQSNCEICWRDKMRKSHS